MDDLLVSIDGSSVAGRSAGRCAAELWLQPGQQVTLHLLRPGDANDATADEECEVTLP